MGSLALQQRTTRPAGTPAPACAPSFDVTPASGECTLVSPDRPGVGALDECLLVRSRPPLQSCLIPAQRDVQQPGSQAVHTCWCSSLPGSASASKRRSWSRRASLSLSFTAAPYRCGPRLTPVSGRSDAMVRWCLRDTVRCGGLAQPACHVSSALAAARRGARTFPPGVSHLAHTCTKAPVERGS